MAENLKPTSLTGPNGERLEWTGIVKTIMPGEWYWSEILNRRKVEDVRLRIIATAQTLANSGVISHAQVGTVSSAVFEFCFPEEYAEFHAPASPPSQEPK